jgi:hypothetical protein
MPQAMERLLASPKTTAVLPAKSIMLVVFLDGSLEEWSYWRRNQSLGYQSMLDATAVLQLVYAEALISEWLFPSGAPATGLRRWGGSKSHLALQPKEHVYWRTP